MLRLEDFRGGPVGTEQDCGKVGPMIKKQTTKLRGSRLTAWQSRGLGLANWNARRPGLLRVFVLCAGPQYSRVSPGPAPCSGPVFSRHSLSLSLSDLRFTSEALPGKPGIWLAV